MRLRGTKLSSIAQSGGLGNQLWDLASSRPSLDLQFADTKSLVDATTGQNLVTFTRASGGTYVDSQGVIRNATTNLLLRSEEFDSTSAWSTVGTTSVAGNSDTDPNGATAADKVSFSAGDYIRQFVNAVAPTTTYTISAWVKKPASNGATAIRITSNNVGSWSTGFSQKFTLTSEWQRVSATGTLISSGTSAYIIFGAKTETNANDADCIGDVLIWGAQLEQSSTVGEYIPTTSTINSAPRFDHNPSTGESLGLLVEEARTNSIRNNTMVGAVAGTPGTLPTSWPYGVAGTGLTRQIVGTGIENGVNYIDIKISGTSGSTAALALAVDRASALTGQSWAGSTYVKLVGGSTTGVTGWDVVFIEETSAFVGVTSGSFSLGIPSSTLTRVSGVRTLSGGATVASLLMRIDVSCTNGAAIDFTLRIGMPQLEQGAFATSVIPTTTATATRAADVASITGTNFSGWYRQDQGSIFLEHSADSLSTSVFVIDDTTTNNLVTVFNSSVANTHASTNFLVSGVNSGRLDAGGTFSARAVRRTCLAFASADRAFAGAGNPASQTTFPATLPTMTRMSIPGSSIFAGLSGSRISRLTYWPTRLSNAVLQSITQ